MSSGNPPHLTESGFPGIGRIPFGVHLCHFYVDRQDLVDSLIPYFRSGLQQDERSLWVTSAPLSSEDASAELAKDLPSFAAWVAEGRIRILDAPDWYGDLRSDHLQERWFKEEERALAEGFQGLRIAGNAGFLERTDWDAFMRYEHAFNRSIAGHRIVALCSYSLRQAGASDLFEITRCHHHTICRTNNDWEVVDKFYGPLARS